MNDEKEARELDELMQKYRFMIQLKEGKERKGWWAWICGVRLRMNIDTIWNEMIIRIPVQHDIEIDNILEQSNIAHYGQH
jgi:hypothetical protein